MDDEEISLSFLFLILKLPGCVWASSELIGMRNESGNASTMHNHPLQRRFLVTTLTKGMFEEHPSPGAFGLCSGQTRSRAVKLAHNGGWHNQTGQYLGWGDLSAHDLKRVSDEIDEGNVFIVLHEHDSYWNYLRRFPSGDPTEKGVAYVAEHASYIVHKQGMYCVDKYDDRTKRVELGIEFDVIRPSEVAELLKRFS